jgi:AH receptor-interacting protein
LQLSFFSLTSGFHFQLVSGYPFLSKTLREAGKPQKQRSHCCGVVLQNEGTGYEDLNQLIKEPCNLAFTIGK